MVLHNNKWDRKAKKAHVRKIVAKGETLETSGTQTKKEGVPEHNKRSQHQSDSKSKDDTSIQTQEENAQSSGSLIDTKAGDSETSNDTAKEGSSDDGFDSNSGAFNKRKVLSNSWRYEEPEEDPYLKAEESEPEPEPDYARMTIGKDQVTFEEVQRRNDDELDIEIDNLSDFTFKKPKEITKEKGKIVKVDRSQFEDVNEKIAKQKAAEVFRQRFSSKKSTNTVDEPDDMDDFLASLNQDEICSPTAGEYIENPEQTFHFDITPTSKGTIQTSTVRVHGKRGCDSIVNSDQWLDDMLGGTSDTNTKIHKR